MRWLALFMLVGFARGVAATTNTYQEGATGCGNTNCGANVPDAYILSAAATTNQGAADPITASTSGTNNHALLTFDVSDITAGSTITAASLILNVTSNTTANVTYHIDRVLQAWVEAQATWNKYSTSNWATAGCNSAGTDYTTTNEVSFTGPSGNGTLTITGLAGIVQDAFDAGVPLRMQIRVATESGTHSFSFNTAENATVGNHPKLSVDWSAPTTTSTSSTTTTTTSTSTTTTTAAAGAIIQRLPLLGVGQLDLPADGDWTCHPAAAVDVCHMEMAG